MLKNEIEQKMMKMKEKNKREGKGMPKRKRKEVTFFIVHINSEGGEFPNSFRCLK